MPGAVKRYPEKLDDLLEDKRYLSVQRYLRKIYCDQITGKSKLGLVSAPDGGVMGVYSLSEDTPIKTGNFSEQDKEFENAEKYADWKFVYQANQQATTPPSTAPTGGAGQPAAAPAPSLPTNIPGRLK